MSAASSVKRSGETAQFRLKRLKSHTAVDAGEATESTDSHHSTDYSTDYAGESKDANQMSLPDADPGAPLSPLRLSDAEANFKYAVRICRFRGRVGWFTVTRLNKHGPDELHQR